MNIARGDILLLEVPFSDLQGSKVRPVLVVQADHNNRRLDDLILAVITSTIKSAGTEPTQYFIDLGTPEGKASNLLHNSSVKCEHIITLDKSLVRRVIGSLPPVAMGKVDMCLKASLGIP